MKAKLNAVLVTLPRWFALPGVLCMVLLGAVLSGGITWLSWLAVVSSLCLMAWGHGMNTFLDYAWTGFDKGGIDERSHEKSYTVGQNVISSGVLSVAESFNYSLLWLVISLIPTFIIYLHVGWLIWLPWMLGALVTFGYSWGKLHYLCEFMLGLGFGPLAVMTGAAASPNPDLLVACLAGLPFFVLWGFGAEFVDQAYDADVNWDKGLRNLGALAWKRGVSIPLFAGFLFACTYLVQLLLILGGVVVPLTGLSFLTIPFFAYGLLIMGNDFNKKGIMLLLAGIFCYAVLFLIGQIVG